MATSSSYVGMCSIHSDKVAIAVCLNTKELLCFQCCMDRAKKQDKNVVKEIDKMSDESEKLLLNCILASQKASGKQKLLKEYEEKANTVKESVRGEVCELYDQLLEKLGEMRDNTFASLESKHDLFLKTCHKDKKELEAVSTTINEHLDKLSTAKESDIDSFKTEIEQVMNKLDDIADYDPSSPDGCFVVKCILKEAIDKCGSRFGEVNIFTTDHYEKPGSVQCQKNENQGDLDEAFSKDELPKIHPKSKDEPPEIHPKSKNEPPKIHPKPSRLSITSASDEFSDDKPKLLPRDKTSKVESPDSEDIQLQNKSQNKEEDAKSPSSEAKDSSKEGKPRKLFSFGKNKAQDKLEEYVDVEFVKRNCPQARHLINTTMALSKLPDQFQTPFKFSKLIAVGTERVCLLSKEHSSIFVAGLDGKVRESKTYSKNSLTSMVGMSDDMIAVLKNSNKEAEIEILQISNGELRSKNSIKLKLDISKFTGFDYSRAKSQFAVGTESQYYVLDKKGKTVKVKTMEATQTFEDIVTIFDFEYSNIFIINKINKSVKCVTFKGETTVWKRRCDDPSFQPVAAHLHQQELCIASPRVITIFAAKDGEPARKHETDDLVKDCHGLCVISDEVIVIASNSNNFEESKKVGFVGF